MKRMFDRIRESLGGLGERSRHRDFVDVVMAGAALVARADRDERLAELVARDRVLARLTDLQWFDVHDAVTAYEQHSRLLGKNAESGKRQLLDKITEFGGDRSERVTLVRACLAVRVPERSVVEQICSALGVDPGELGVYDI